MTIEKHYSITIRALTITEGSGYGIGAKIYRDGSSAELVKVCSLYICAGSRQEATVKAAAQLSKEIEPNSAVCFTVHYLGTLKRRILKAIQSEGNEQQHKVYAHNNHYAETIRNWNN